MVKTVFVKQFKELWPEVCSWIDNKINYDEKICLHSSAGICPRYTDDLLQ